jgi:site-specific DNA-cytosine methylase/intein/homing endonuclease
MSKNKLKVVSLFSGYGTQELALKYIGVDYENVANCDNFKQANECYDVLHTTTHGNLGDIRMINENTFPECDLLTYSFPCFTKDTLVLTSVGYKNIVDVEIDDLVLTHTNTYKKVTNKFDQGKKEIWEIKSPIFDELKTTENHRFYVRTRINGNKNNTTKPHWKECKDLTKNDYLGVAINQNSIIPKWGGIEFKWNDGRKPRYKNELSQHMDNEDFWWLIGRYIGDGWSRNQAGIIICCTNKNDSELQEISERLERLKFNAAVVRDGSTYKIHLPKKEIGLFVEQFGKYAHGKKLTNTIFDLPRNLLTSFIQGYFSADGSFYQNSTRQRIISVSRELIYGIGQCIAKCYNVPYSIYKTKNKDKYIIEGRYVNQRDSYTIAFDLDQSKNKKSFFDNGFIWTPIKGIINTNNTEFVYDIEVDEDHSFTANGCIAHNCQDISISGVQKGIKEGTRSGLLFEVERLLSINRPKFLLMENVKNLISKNHIDNFQKHIYFLRGLGYSSFWRVLNGADFGCPQNRERVFMMSVLNSSIDDVREKMTNVDNHKKERLPMRSFIDQNFNESLIVDCHFTPHQPKKHTICKLVGRRDDISYDQARRIYSVDGCSPTLTTSGSPQILTEDGRVRTITAREGYRFMGVKEQDIDLLLTTSLSNTAHVALAGNSICVPVMEAIFTEFFSDYITKEEPILSNPLNEEIND